MGWIRLLSSLKEDQLKDFVGSIMKAQPILLCRYISTVLSPERFVLSGHLQPPSAFYAFQMNPNYKLLTLHGWTSHLSHDREEEA